MLVIMFTLMTGCRFVTPETPSPQQPQRSVIPQTEGEAAGLPQGLGTATNPQTTTTAAARVIPSVVGITTVTLSKDLKAETRRVQGVGSGVIIDPNGHILTNNHVAGMGAEKITVHLYDGRNVKGRTIWADPVLDLSVVKIDAGRLPAATLANSQAVQVGEQAIAIGNPLGLTFERTVTSGIISALNRTIPVEGGNFMEGLIQTDASINPGNSGGPLININGEVVGINTVKVAIAEGMGFAVPINIAKPVIQRISTEGTFATPTMGIQGLDRELSDFYDFVIDKGIYVYDCKDGQCGHKAGIRKGNVILSIDGREVNTSAEFREAIFAAGAGKEVTVRVRDANGQEKDVKVKLDTLK